jgi:phage shock protein A
MRGNLNIIFAILMGCSLILAVHQYSTLAQSPSAQKSPRDMIDQLQREIEDMQAKIAENPSSAEAEKLRKTIQWNKRKIKGILPSVAEQAGNKMEKEKASIYGLERYMIIAQKNLFTPLGSGGEAKQQEFAVTGILSSGAKKMALIQLIDGSASYYVAEGETFGNGAKLARIGENSVTIIHEGNNTELKLGEGVSGSQSRRGKGGESVQRGKPSPKAERERMEDARRENEENAREIAEKQRRENEERERMEQEIRDLHRTREEVKQKIMEMERSGHVDPDAYRKVEEIDHRIRDLESSLR